MLVISCFSDYVYGLYYMGAFRTQQYWVALMTPTFSINRTHCLSIGLQTTGPIMIYQSTSDGRKMLILDSGPEGSIITADIKIPVLPVRESFFFQIEWPSIKVTKPGYYTVIKHMKFFEGNCRDEQYAMLMGEKCTFEDGQCGFNFGEPVARWMPIIAKPNVQNYGKMTNCLTFMKTVDKSDKKVDCLLIKSLTQQTRIGCFEEACRLDANLVNFFSSGEPCDHDNCPGDCELRQCSNIRSPIMISNSTGADVYQINNGMYD